MTPRLGRPRWTPGRQIGLCALAIAVYQLAPNGGVPQGIAYLVAAVSAPVAVIGGIRRHQPVRRRGWTLIATASCLWAAGEVTWYFEQLVLHIDSPFGPPDVFYLSAVGVLFFGLRELVRTKTGRADYESLLDGLVLASEGAAILWFFSLGRHLGPDGSSMAVRTLLVVYPLLDLLLLSVATRLGFLGAAGNRSTVYLLSAVFSLLGADLGYAVVLQHTGGEPPWVDIGWLLWFAFLGAAALHPSMASLADGVIAERRPPSLAHMLLVSQAVLSAPVLLLVDARTDRMEAGLLIIATVVIASVLVRMSVLAGDRERMKERHRSEQRFRALIQHANDGICILDGGKVVYASPALARILDRPAEQLRGTDVASLVAAGDEDRLRALIVEAASLDPASGDGLARAVVHLPVVDGRQPVAEVTAVDHRLEPNIGGIVLNIRDVTERRDAERSIRRSEQRLRAAARNLPVVLLAWDADGTITLCEGRALEDVGLEPGGLVGTRLHRADGAFRPIADALAPLLSGSARELATDVVVGHRVFQVAAAAVDLGDEEPSFLGVATDVTRRAAGESEARRRADRARASAEISATILDGAFDGARLLDEVLSEVGAAIGATCAAFLAPGGDSLDLTTAGVVPNAGEGGARRAWATVGPVTDRPVLIGPAGFEPWDEDQPCRSVAVPLRSQGADLGLLLVERDDEQPPFEVEDVLFLSNVGERTALALENCRLFDAAQVELEVRRRTEEILRGSEQRWRAFGTEASHQLRTPLTGLRLRIENELLETDQRDRSPVEWPAVLAELLARVDDMGRTVDDFLSLVPGRLSSSGPLEVTSLLEELDRVWRRLIEGAGRVFRVESEPGLPTALVSRAAARQALGVLIENALRHGAGAVTLSAKCVAGAIAFEVSDEGPGFATEPALDGGRGAGIGLTLARSLAEAEGARLHFAHTGPSPRIVLYVPSWETDVEATWSASAPARG